MSRIVAPLFALVLMLGVAAAALANEDVKKYTIDPMTFPDGIDGVAVVRVILSDGAEAAAPTVMVTVDYYTADYAEYLGRYEDWSSSGDFPTNEYEAEDFAYAHYHDRW